MAANSTGVYQKDNGYWEYRFVMMVDGKQKPVLQIFEVDICGGAWYNTLAKPTLYCGKEISPWGYYTLFVSTK